MKKARSNTSMFQEHPVSHVIWVPAETVQANDYNPNTVAPPEMKLLELSIQSDGFTQPIVCWETEDHYEVIDGFHRHLVGRKLGLTHLPIVIVNKDRTDRNDRIAATIRHNRARGKHQIGAMSDIVVELKRRNWSNARIVRELGMESDEVLRLSQVAGLAEMFANKIFASEQAIPDAKHRGITPALTRLVNEPDAKMEKAKSVKSPRGEVFDPME